LKLCQLKLANQPVLLVNCLVCDLMTVVLIETLKFDELKSKLVGLTGFSVGFSRSRRKVEKNGQKMSKIFVIAFLHICNNIRYK
jgi:hypothetical protein